MRKTKSRRANRPTRRMIDKRSSLTLRAAMPTARKPAAPQMATRDIVTRSIQVRAATLDEKTRSVEVVIATQGQVTVFDWWRCEVIDEILIADGGTFPDQLPLLANHSRFSLDDVLGSVREIRRDGDEWVGRAFFAEGDEESDKAWNKVRQGHLRDVSVGYQSTDYEDVAPESTLAVDGTEYTAGERRLRITREWEAKEVSVVPIGADPLAKVRRKPFSSPTGDRSNSMNPQLRKYLESIGLRRGASVKEAKEFHKGLNGVNRTLADGILAGTINHKRAIAAGGDQKLVRELLKRAVSADQTSTDDAEALDEEEDNAEEEDPEEDPMDNEEPTDGRSATTLQVRNGAGSAQTREDAVRAERDRVKAIRGLGASDVPTELVTRAIDDGWSTARASREFLTAVRESRSPSVPAGGAPGGIVHNHERDCNVRTLGLALVIRSNVNIEQYAKRHRIQGWENLAQQADQYREMSLYDVCREALRIEGRQVPYGRDETIRAAVSTGALSQIFTTSVNATLLQAWEEEPDSTIGWVSESDENDFKTNTAIKTDGSTGLEKLPRGGTAKDATMSDSAETYKLARYAKKFSIDEQDIIDDSFGALMEMPMEFGQGARRLRPDLVYAILLANPTLAETTGQLFNSTAVSTAGGHANLQTGALTADTLQTSMVAMGKQYLGSGKNKKPLNINPEHIIVPGELRFTAEILVSSAERIISAASGGTFNPLKGKLQVHVENRVGALGVTDPRTGTAYTGTATNYFLASRPGRTIRVAYRKGTARGPQLRSYVLDKGQWGIGWDVNLDITAVALDYRGLLKSTGA
jgi:hypothetical protein